MPQVISITSLINKLTAIRNAQLSETYVAIARDSFGRAALVTINGNVVDFCNPVLTSNLTTTHSVPLTAEQLLSCTTI